MHPHRSSALGYASAASAAHSRVYGACAAEAAASETSGLSVGGCPEHRRYFGPHPVHARFFTVVCTSRRGCAGCAHIRAVPRTVTKFKCYSASFFELEGL